MRFAPQLSGLRPFATKLGALTTLTAIALGGATANATIYTWNGASTGASGTNAWSGAGNWVGSAAPPTASGNNDLVFAGNTRTTNGPNTSYTVNSLEFLPGAGAFNIVGIAGSRTVTLNSSITNNSAAPQTIGVPTGGTGGQLTLAMSAAPTIKTIDTAYGNIDIAAGLTGSGVVINKTGPFTLGFVPSSAANTITGTMNVQNGIVNVQRSLTSFGFDVSSGAGLQVAAVTVGNVTNAGTVATVADGANITNITTSGTLNILGNTTAGQVTVTGTTAYTLIPTGKALNASSVTLAGTVDVDGTLISTGTVAFAPGTKTNFTVGDASSGLMSYTGTSAFKGDLYVDITDNYPVVDLISPQTFTLFNNTNGNASSTSFDTISVFYDGSIRTLMVSGTNPNQWYSAEFTNSVSNEPQYLFFSNATGELMVVPEPSAMVIAGVGVALAGWRMARRRKGGKPSA